MVFAKSEAMDETRIFRLVFWMIYIAHTPPNNADAGEGGAHPRLMAAAAEFAWGMAHRPASVEAGLQRFPPRRTE